MRKVGDDGHVCHIFDFTFSIRCCLVCVLSGNMWINAYYDQYLQSSMNG